MIARLIVAALMPLFVVATYVPIESFSSLGNRFQAISPEKNVVASAYPPSSISLEATINPTGFTMAIFSPFFLHDFFIT